MPVSLLDIVVLGVVVISAVLAMMRGFTREVLAIASWGTAAVVAYLLHPQVLPYVKPYIANDKIALPVAIGAVFLITLVLVSLITVKLSDFILDSKIGALDRTLGFIFGAARGALICVIGFAFFSWLVPADKQPEWVKTSRSKPFLESSGTTLMSMLPDDPEKAILQRFKKPGTGSDTPPAETAPARPGQPPQQRSGVTAPPAAVQTADRQQLRQMLETTGSTGQKPAR
ncbi:MAG: CvpA family protein [Beijerinckiaceae bacterium]